MPKIYYTVKMDGRLPYALVLETREAHKPEKYHGYYNQQELHENMKSIFGPDVECLPGSKFQAEVERRQVHTKEMIALLWKQGDLLGEYLCGHVVYGSYRPISASWARIDNAVYIQVDEAGYHTYVAVPGVLDNEVIERYELHFVSRPGPDEVTQLRELLRGYYDAALLGGLLEDATDSDLRNYEEIMSDLQQRARVVLGIE